MAGGQQGQLFNLAVLAVGLLCPEVRAVGTLFIPLYFLTCYCAPERSVGNPFFL
ncbi:MAG: hypothetical protein ACK56F_10575 [bacterium]